MSTHYFRSEPIESYTPNGVGRPQNDHAQQKEMFTRHLCFLFPETNSPIHVLCMWVVHIVISCYKKHTTVGPAGSSLVRYIMCAAQKLAARQKHSTTKSN